ncbi:hypothetical protein H0H93_007532 [Arthromyces matolae]|nr:hypothetical protein H0H93_007532 [Arthromyces matolae]
MAHICWSDLSHPSQRTISLPTKTENPTMQTRAVFYIFAGVVFFLGPFLSTVTAIPLNGQIKQCGIPPGNDENMCKNMASAREAGKQALDLRHQRAELLFSQDAVTAEIRSMKASDFHLWPELKELQRTYLLQDLIWIDYLVAFDTIVAQLHGFSDTAFPSTTFISNMFETRKAEENGKLEHFYSHWTTEFVQTNDVEKIIEEYYSQLSVAHSRAFLRQFRLDNEQRSGKEIIDEANKAEASARRGKSEMKMTESLLLRFIHVRKQSDHELFRSEERRLNELISSQEWDKLSGLLHWLLEEYLKLIMT